MTALMDAQVRTMLWLQAHHAPALDSFLEVFTNFGGTYYLLRVPLALWCVDYRVGVRIALLIALTLFVNTTLKNWVQLPRPFQFDPRILSAGESGFSFPSGHAMLVVAYRGVLADHFRKPAFSVFAVAVMLLMAFSRVYLGVHFPTDVTVGLLLGALLLWVALRRRAALETWLGEQTPAACAGLGAALFGFDALAVPDPLNEHLNAGAAGFLAGAGAGAALGAGRPGFTGRGPGWRRALRFLLGMLVTGGLLAALRRLGAPDGGLADLVVAIDLAGLGLAVVFALPWLFARLRLAD